MTKRYLLEQMTWTEARDALAQNPVVVIPIGSTEQHGPHMPLGTDFLVAQEIARRLGERADVIVTPTVCFGYAKYHTSFPGTLAVTDDTLTRMLIEITEDLASYGITHILFLNGHGGNIPSIQRCGAALRGRDVLMALANWYLITKVVNPAWQCIGHGDYVETAAVLAVDESLPKMDIAKIPEHNVFSDTITLNTPHDAQFENASVYVNLFTADLTNTGDMLEYGLTAATDFSIPPTAGTKEMGEEILDGVADYLARFVPEFRKIKLRPLASLKK